MPAAHWTPDTLARLSREILPAYVPTCRWFGGKGRAVRELRVVHAVPIGRLAEARLLVVEVSFAEGLPESYVLPLSFLDPAAAAALAATHPHAVLAREEDGWALCDALQLPAVRAELLRLIMQRGESGADVRLTGTSRDDLDPALLGLACTDSRVIGADQSNTAVIYAGRWFLKLFRKFEPGPNPDVELLRFLSEGSRFPHVPAYVGALQLTAPPGAGVIALLSTFTPNQGDAWTFTLESVARAFDRVPALPPEAAPETFVGAEYLDRARQLGQRTAGLHLALASGEDQPAFAAEPFSLAEQRSLADVMSSSARQVLAQLHQQEAQLPVSLRPAAIALARSQARIDALFARLYSHPIAAAKLRVHGDYHLGQVLNTGSDFVILDFEGEPRRPLHERLGKRSPLVDVAGMLRSFDYAGAVALRQRPPEEAAKLAPWARQWVNTVSAHFLHAYLATATGAAFLPPERDDVNLLLKVFILDKAIYELGYELSYRPDFLPVPLGAVSRLLAEDDERRAPG